MYKLDPEDVFNFDQTAVLLTPQAGSGKTRFTKGAKDVVGKSHDNKRQITCVPVISAAGEKLPLQLIFKEKDGQTGAIPDGDTKNQLKNLKKQYPGYLFAHTSNQWSTVATNLELMKETILPFAEASKSRRRAIPGSTVSNKIVVILDCWRRAQKSPAFIDAVKRLSEDIILLYVPPNLTGQFQPLDVAVNSTFKRQVKDAYGQWAGKEVMKQRQAGVSLASIHLDLEGLKKRKSCCIQWASEGWNRVKTADVILGWQKVGLLNAWDANVQEQAQEALLAGTLFPMKPSGGMDIQPIPDGIDAPLGANEDLTEEEEDFDVVSDDSMPLV